MKKIILSIIALFTILVGSSLVAYYFVDMNGYKSDIIHLVEEKTGNNIVINGDIRLRILPEVALDINRISLPARSGNTAEDAVYIKQLIVHLKILPLFKKRVEIASLNIINPEVKYTIFKDGSNNFSKTVISAVALQDNKNKKASETIAEEPNKNYSLQRNFINTELLGKFNLSDITVQSGKAIFSDERNGVFVELKDVKLETSFTPEINPIKISANIVVSPGISAPFELLAKYHISNDKYEVSAIEIAVGGIKAHGEIITDFRGILPEAKVTFYFEDMDLTPYSELIEMVSIPLDKDITNSAASAPDNPKYSKNKKASQLQGQAIWSDEPINFMVLRDFNANLNFKSNKILYKNNNIGSITVYAYLINGKFTFSLKEAEVFDGNINSETTIDVTSAVPKIKYKLNLEEVDFAKLPDKFAVANKFTGKVNGGAMLASHGLSRKEIIENLSGDISLKAEDGVIRNIDLISMAKNTKTAFEVNANLGSITSFKELSGDFNVTNGVVKSDNLQLSSEILDFNGHGTVNLGDMSLNMTLTPKSKHVNDDKDIFGGIKAPIVVSGTIMQPIFKLEIQNLVEDLIKNPKATENLVKQLKSDFKDIKNNMKSDNKDNNSSGFFDDIKNILKAF